METYKFIPSAVSKGEFEGDVTVKFMEFEERWAAYGQFEDIRRQMDDDAGGMKAKIDLMLFLAKCAKPFVVAVSMKRKSDNRSYDNIDQLTRDPRCGAIFQEIAMFIIAGQEPDEGKQ